VAVLFLDHILLGGEPGIEKAPFTSNILKITYKLYTSLVKKETNKNEGRTE
jgi:hypothetical protein